MDRIIGYILGAVGVVAVSAVVLFFAAGVFVVLGFAVWVLWVILEAVILLATGTL